MIDIDYFKAINDTYGHLTGGLVLKRTAAMTKNIASNQGKRDVILGRYGGEEFILFIGADTKRDVIKTVEAIRGLQIQNFIQNIRRDCLE